MPVGVWYRMVLDKCLQVVWAGWPISFCFVGEHPRFKSHGNPAMGHCGRTLKTRRLKISCAAELWINCRGLMVLRGKRVRSKSQ